MRHASAKKQTTRVTVMCQRSYLLRNDEYPFPLAVPLKSVTPPNADSVTYLISPFFFFFNRNFDAGGGGREREHKHLDHIIPPLAPPSQTFRRKIWVSAGPETHIRVHGHIHSSWHHMNAPAAGIAKAARRALQEHKLTKQHPEKCPCVMESL